MIELNKELQGADPVDDWIRLFNAETEEELKMLEMRTRNAGILEVIKEVRLMGMGRTLKAMYDAHMKEIRDRNARDDYVREEGKVEGRIEGIAEGRQEGEERLGLLILRLTEDKRTEEISKAAEDRVYRERLYQEYKL